MGLNIKNEAVVGLVRELARARNVDMTEAIRQAVEHELQGTERRRLARLNRMRTIEERIARAPERDSRALEELLYDERGLPK
jgi:antitoxin VapB